MFWTILAKALLYPKPQSWFFFSTTFNMVNQDIIPRSFYHDKAVLCSNQDVSTHMRFTMLKSKEICRYSWQISYPSLIWKNNFNCSTYRINESCRQTNIAIQPNTTHIYSRISIDSELHQYIFKIIRMPIDLELHRPFQDKRILF